MVLAVLVATAVGVELELPSLPDGATDPGGISLPDPGNRDAQQAEPPASRDTGRAPPSRCHSTTSSFDCVRWAIDLDGPASITERGARPIGDDLLAIATEDGRVHGISLVGRQVAWSYDPGDADRPTRLLEAGDDLVVVSRRSASLLDVDSGEPVWERSGIVSEALLDRRELFAASVHDGMLVHEAHEAVVGRDLATGEVSWRTPIDAHERVTVTDAGVLVTDHLDGAVAVLAPGSGDVRWSRDLDLRTAAAGGSADTVYLETRDGTLSAVDAADGETRWSAPPEGDGRLTGDVREVGRTVLATTDDDEGSHLIAYDRTDGDRRWRRPTAQAVPLQFAFAATRDVVVTLETFGVDPTVAARSRSDGRMLWQTNPLPRTPYLAEVTDGMAVLSHQQGVTAVWLDDGAQRWSLDLGPSHVVIDDPLVAVAGTRAWAVNPDGELPGMATPGETDTQALPR